MSPSETLWTAVDNACGKPRASRPRLNALSRDKSLEIVDALVDAVALLAARVDGLEALMDEFVSIIDKPLSPTESIDELRRLREEMR